MLVDGCLLTLKSSDEWWIAERVHIAPPFLPSDPSYGTAAQGVPDEAHLHPPPTVPFKGFSHPVNNFELAKNIHSHGHCDGLVLEKKHSTRRRPNETEEDHGNVEEAAAGGNSVKKYKGLLRRLSWRGGAGRGSIVVREAVGGGQFGKAEQGENGELYYLQTLDGNVN